MLRYSLLLAAIAALDLQGCANLSSVYRPLDTSEGKGALIDIKQRAILSGEVPDSSNGGTKRTMVCAEPSPDALSAYAAQLSADANVPEKVAVQIAASFGEGSSFVGLRTQSIQLLRDALYRLCEGYLGGALDRAQYDLLMRRYQKYMVALLGIEQITGVVRASAATISTSGTAEAARSLSSMRAEIEKIDAKIATIEASKAASGVTDAQKADLERQIAALKEDKSAINKGIENARGLLATSTATAAIVASPQGQSASDERMRSATAAVKEIVLEVVQTEDTGQLCLLHLANYKGTGGHPLQSFCDNFLRNIVEADVMRVKAGAEILKTMESEAKKGQPDHAKIQNMSEWLKKVVPEHTIANQPRPKLPTS